MPLSTPLFKVGDVIGALEVVAIGRASPMVSRSLFTVAWRCCGDRFEATRSAILSKAAKQVACCASCSQLRRKGPRGPSPNARTSPATPDPNVLKVNGHYWPSLTPRFSP